jgi:hypothetical protein
MDNQKFDLYQQTILNCFRTTEAYSPRDWAGRRNRLPGGVPILTIGKTVYGPQAATVTVRVRDEDLARLTTPVMGERLAYTARSHFAYTYRYLDLLRVEFTLPPERWRVVPLSGLPQHRDALAIGQQATGQVARLDWKNPHKAVFGSTQYGKSTFLVDYMIAIAKTYSPEECRVFLCNPKNEMAFHPLNGLPHLGAKVAVDYADCERLLFWIVAEIKARRGDAVRQRQRWVVLVDEVAELVENRPDVAKAIRTITQMGGGLGVNLIAASQSANPTVFGNRGSQSKTNFSTKIIFSLPSSQAYLATDIGGRQYPVEKLGLGGKGDCIIVSNGLVTRCRAALPSETDFATLPKTETVVALPQMNEPVGERVLEVHPEYNRRVIGPDETTEIVMDYQGKTQHWTPELLGQAVCYILKVSASTEKVRAEFGIGTNKARAARDVVEAMRRYSKQLKGG